jgi:hypothetical protein
MEATQAALNVLVVPAIDPNPGLPLLQLYHLPDLVAWAYENKDLLGRFVPAVSCP